MTTAPIPESVGALKITEALAAIRTSALLLVPHLRPLLPCTHLPPVILGCHAAHRAAAFAGVPSAFLCVLAADFRNCSFLTCTAPLALPLRALSAPPGDKCEQIPKSKLWQWTHLQWNG
ncbi:hypothetical protein MTO96_018848 [Rhipicephalus appendiculatus]